MISLEKFSYDSKKKSKDKIQEASNLYLKIGDFRNFCECLIKMGRFN